MCAFMPTKAGIFLDNIPALTHCILVDSSTVICCTSPFVILIFDGKSHYVASDLGLH